MYKQLECDPESIGDSRHRQAAPTVTFVKATFHTHNGDLGELFTFQPNGHPAME